MGVLYDVQKLIHIIEHLAPRQCDGSALYRVAAKAALRSAARAELEGPRYNDEASEGPQENEQCNTQAPDRGWNDLNDTLRELLPTRRRDT
jgi:hypothetical protein